MHLNDIKIRTEIRPGDLGFVIHRHGKIYCEEYNYGVEFEMYVASGLHEFYTNYDPAIDRVWICEHNDIIIGFLLLMHREHNSAQLRYFYIEKEYRGIGLGKALMELFMQFLFHTGYKSAYLWTTNELHEAVSLYMKHGFKLTQEKESGAFGKKLVEQRYVLNLT